MKTKETCKVWEVTTKFSGKNETCKICYLYEGFDSKGRYNIWKQTFALQKCADLFQLFLIFLHEDAFASLLGTIWYNN